jgi:hypothetical protein
MELSDKADEKPEPLSKQICDSARWFDSHEYKPVLQRYAKQWVLIYECKVIAHGQDIRKMCKIARKKTGLPDDREFLCEYVHDDFDAAMFAAA